MNSSKDRFITISLGIAITLVANGILFTGLPLLTQIQRGFQAKKFDNPILLTAHKPPKPPDPEKERRLKERKPKKAIKKKKAKQQRLSKPKLDLPKFEFALGGDLGGGIQISAAPRQDFRAVLARTAFTLAEVDQPPRVIRKIDPLYPFAAKRKNIEGKVVLRFIVTKDGRVLEPSIVRAEPPGVFDNSALKAILRWRFRPAVKDGRDVDVIVIAPLRFELIK